MTHQETLTLIKEVVESDIGDWEKIVRIGKLTSKTYKNKNSIKLLTLEDIKNQIINHSGLTLEKLNERTRNQTIVEYRQLAHFKSKRDTIYSDAQIGEYFGNKNTKTVMWSFNTVQNLLDTNRIYRKKHESFLNS